MKGAVHCELVRVHLSPNKFPIDFTSLSLTSLTYLYSNRTIYSKNIKERNKSLNYVEIRFFFRRPSNGQISILTTKRKSNGREQKRSTLRNLCKNWPCIFSNARLKAILKATRLAEWSDLHLFNKPKTQWETTWKLHSSLSFGERVLHLSQCHTKRNAKSHYGCRIGASPSHYLPWNTASVSRSHIR